MVQLDRHLRIRLKNCKNEQNYGRRLSTIFRRNASISISDSGGNGGSRIGTICGWNKMWVGTEHMDICPEIGVLTFSYLLQAAFCNSPCSFSFNSIMVFVLRWDSTLLKYDIDILYRYRQLLNVCIDWKRVTGYTKKCRVLYIIIRLRGATQ